MVAISAPDVNAPPLPVNTYRPQPKYCEPTIRKPEPLTVNPVIAADDNLSYFMFPTPRETRRADFLGVNSKVPKMPRPNYGAALPGNAWDAVAASISTIQGQPFEWAVYYSFGAFQIAVNSQHFACRFLEATGDYTTWNIIK